MSSEPKGGVAPVETFTAEEWRTRYVRATQIIHWAFRAIAVLVCALAMVTAVSGFGLWRSLQAAHDFGLLRKDINKNTYTLKSGRADRQDFQEEILAIEKAQGIILCNIADTLGADTNQGQQASEACKEN